LRRGLAAPVNGRVEAGRGGRTRCTGPTTSNRVAPVVSASPCGPLPRFRVDHGYHVPSAVGSRNLDATARHSAVGGGVRCLVATGAGPGTVRPVGAAGNSRPARASARNDSGSRRARTRRRTRGRGRVGNRFATAAPPAGTADQRHEGHQGQRGQDQTGAEHGRPRGDGRPRGIATGVPSVTTGRVGAIAPTRPRPMPPAG
jgi:hypothetical protein